MIKTITINGKEYKLSKMAGLDLRGVVLKEAYLKGANLTEANLEGADLLRANLTGATMPDGTPYNGGSK